MMASDPRNAVSGKDEDIAASTDKIVSESSKQLVKRQLNININEVAKLSVDQTKKLIEIQAKKIDLTKWEYDRFLATCIESDYLDKGLIILFNYAGNMDKIEIFTRKYSLMRNNLFGLLKSNETMGDLFESIKDLAALTLKLLYAIGSLRKLQCSPKPIMVECVVDGQAPCVLTTQAILRKTAEQLVQLDDAKKSDIAKSTGTTTLTTLLSPFLDAFELQNLLSKVSKNVSMQDRQILTTMRSVLEIEDRVEATWMAIQPESTSPSKTAIDPFPLLRLPYAETEKYDNHFIWFNDVIGSYKGLCNAVLEELTVLQNLTPDAPTAPKLMSKSSDVALRAEPFSASSASGKGSSKKEAPALERRPTPGGPSRSKSQSLLSVQKPSPSALVAPAVVAPSPLSSKKAALSRKGLSANIARSPSPSSPLRAKSPGGNGDRCNSRASGGSSPGLGSNRYMITTNMMYSSGMSSATHDTHDSDGGSYEGNYYASPARGYTKTRHNPFTKVAAVTFSPAERMMEKDLLKRGFRLAKKKGGSRFEIARRKIKIWWRIVYPRFCYLRRQCLKQFIQEVVLDLADNATTFAIIRTRRRLRWVRERAVLKIQTQFRSWMRRARKELSKITREQRRIVLEANLRAWCVSVKGTCIVLKWFMRVHKMLRKLNPYRRPVSRARCVYGYWDMLQQRNQAKLEKSTLSRARFRQYKRERGAVCIQKYVRRLINKNRMQEKFTYIFMKQTLKKFMQRHDIRNKVERRRVMKAASIKIQCAARGFLRRNALYRRFNSSILIFNFFKKIKATKNLRKTLRRSERPYKILIDKVSGIVEYFDKTEPMRIKVSVWWHPLLHIVSLDDFATVMSTKNPQFVAETAEVMLVPDLNDVEEQSLRKYSTSGTGGINMMKATGLKFGGNNSSTAASGKWQAVFFKAMQIPGCHGNSAIKFEIFSGDRKYATLTHYLNEYGKLMFWRGKYDRSINLIRKTGSNRAAFQGSTGRSGRVASPASSSRQQAAGTPDVPPSLHYSIESGPPNRSKCSWAKVKISGNGPGKSAMRGKGILISFFENWVKFYLSMDDEYLMLFESRHSVQPFYQILLRDMKTVVVESGVTTASGSSSLKFLAEDNKNIVVSTERGDCIYLRMGKPGLRVLWIETLNSVLAYNKKRDEEDAKDKGGADDRFLNGIHSLTQAFSQRNLPSLSSRFVSLKHTGL